MTSALVPTIGTAKRRVAEDLTAAGIGGDEARAEARLLLEHVTGRSATSLLVNEDVPLTPEEADRLADLTARRARREPLAYLLGERWFFGLPFRVTPAVLIPRPETELLVEIALNHLKDIPQPRLLDVGTGSGCIAVAIAKSLLSASVFATDLSPDALTVARENADRNGVTVDFREGDLTAPVQQLTFDAIVSNPPYIAPEEIERLEPEVRDWEPRLALGTAADPLQIYRRLADEARTLLTPGGLLAVEVGLRQAEAVAEIFAGNGFERVNITPDLAGIGRVVSGYVVGRWPYVGRPKTWNRP